ncbi:MAG: helix-turn-helix domain-containing protein [Tannerellaceae bacterium]|jgi:AraC-like DNA-binding protein|nr:helix-turn-helix domain-containing protein [Tannerellaceae bacterium]
MNKFPLIEISELTDHMTDSDNFQDIFTITDVNGVVSAPKFENGICTEPVRLNATLMLLVLKGACNISLNYVPYTLKTNSFAVIIPSHLFQISGMDDDFKAKLLIVGKSFSDEISMIKRGPSVSNYMLLRENPTAEFKPEETKHLEKTIELLQEKIRLRAHFFHKEVLQNAFIAFALELANIMVVRKKVDLVHPTLSQKEELLNNFLQLLSEHVKEQHAVTFYAGKLFVTPQYLSLLLKELTGKSAIKWVNNALVAEAKLLLKTPRYTIQQIADSLNFSDQSTFGKFFKRLTGMSPMQYRRS